MTYKLILRFPSPPPVTADNLIPLKQTSVYLPKFLQNLIDCSIYIDPLWQPNRTQNMKRWTTSARQPSIPAQRRPLNTRGKKISNIDWTSIFVSFSSFFFFFLPLCIFALESVFSREISNWELSQGRRINLPPSSPSTPGRAPLSFFFFFFFSLQPSVTLQRGISSIENRKRI